MNPIFFSNSYTGNVVVEMDNSGESLNGFFDLLIPNQINFLPFLPKDVPQIPENQSIYFRRVNKTSINEQNNFKNEKRS